jgi:hypothetical protein
MTDEQAAGTATTPEPFGRWTVLEHRGEYRLCRCTCGTEKRVQYHTLKSGQSQSCGCAKREARGTRINKL